MLHVFVLAALAVDVACEESFPAVEVIVSVGNELVPYLHPGGKILDEDMREFCRGRLEAALLKAGIYRDEKREAAFGLLENLWPSCRATLRDQLPSVIRRKLAKERHDIL